MKNKLKEKYLSEFYRNHLLDKLHNLHQGNISFRDYIAIFDNLTLRCDVREDHYQAIPSFCSALGSNIRRVMLTSSYHVDSGEKAFHLALELELCFKRIFIFKVKKQCL